MAKLIKILREVSTMVIERKIAVQPENIEDRLYPIADHWSVASKPKCQTSSQVLRKKKKRLSRKNFLPYSRVGFSLPRGLTVDFYQKSSSSIVREIVPNPLTFRVGDTGLEPVTSAV